MSDQEPLDFALLFAPCEKQLSLALPKLRDSVKPDGRIWISWRREPSATERARLADQGLKEIERSMIGADWLAVRFRLRRKAQAR